MTGERTQTHRSAAARSSKPKSGKAINASTRGQINFEALSDFANSGQRVRQLSSLSNFVNRNTKRRLDVNSKEIAANRPGQRYYALNQDMQAGLNVSMQEGTVFPGHEQSEDKPDFLNDDKSVNRVNRKEMPDLAVSDDGHMAIENVAVNGSREVESFFATPAVVNIANAALKGVESKIDLKLVGGQSVDVPDLQGSSLHKLHRIVPQQAPSESDDSVSHSSRQVAPSGADLLAPEQCVEFAQEIVGQSGLVMKIADSDVDIYNADNIREIMIQFLAGYLSAASTESLAAVRASKLKDYISSATSKAREAIQYAIVMRRVTEQFVTLNAYVGNRLNVDAALGVLKNENKLILKEDPIGSSWEHSNGYFSWARYSKRFRVTHPKNGSNEELKFILQKQLNNTVLEVGVESRTREAGIDNEGTGDNMDRAMDDVLNNQVLNSPLIGEANRLLGLNEYAQPSVGEAYMIFHKGTVGDDQNFPYHYAAVVAKSGVDSVTLENYARDVHENDKGSSNRMYFQMYGPKRSVKVQDRKIGRLSKEKSDEADSETDEYREGSFHGRWADIFSSPSTITVKKGGVE